MSESTDISPAATAFVTGATGFIGGRLVRALDQGERFTCEYERTKFEAHLVAQQYAREGLPLVIVLPGAVYGEGDPSVLGLSFERLAGGTFPATISGAADYTLTYVHVDDVVRGIQLAHEKGRVGESYILAGEVMSFGEMVRCVTEIASSSPPAREIPLWLARVLPMASRGCAAASRSSRRKH